MRAKILLIFVAAALSGVVAAFAFGEEGRWLTGPLYRTASGLWEEAKPGRGLGLTFDAPADVTVLGLGESRDPQSYSRRTSKSFGGESNFQLVHLFPAESSIARLSRGVGRISLWDPVNLQSTCTGTLISADYILTAAHCFFVRPNDFAQARDFKTLTVRFHLGYLYEKEEAAVVLEVEPKPIELVCPKRPCTQSGDRDPDFEYAILKLAPNQYARALSAGFEFAKLGNVRIVKNHQFAILHHPLGREMVVSERHCLGAELSPQRGAVLFDHTCDTEEGSSGAPIFSRDHAIVAGIHVRGMEINPPGDRDEIEPNQGIHIQSIAARSKIIGGIVAVEQVPLTAEQAALVDVANQVGEQSAALLGEGRTTLAAYVAMSGLKELTRHPTAEASELLTRADRARFHLANALYAGREAATLEHQDAIGDVRLSPNGSALYVQYAPIYPPRQQLCPRLWNLKTGQSTTLACDGDLIQGGRFSPDGKRLVTWSFYGGVAKLWDAASGRSTATLKLSERAVAGVQFSSDSRRLATWHAEERAFTLWDTESGRQLARPTWDSGSTYFALPGKSDGVGLDFSPDNSQVATWTADSVVRLWNATNGRPLGELALGEKQEVAAAAFSPNGQRLVTVSRNQLVGLWNAATREPIRRFAAAGGVSQPSWLLNVNVLFSSDSSQFVTLGSRALLFNTNDGRLPLSLEAEDGVPSSAVFSPDSARLLTGGPSRRAMLWDTRKRSLLETLIESDGDVSNASFSADSAAFVTRSRDTSVHFLWRAANGSLVARLEGGRPGSFSGGGGAVFSPDNTQIVTWTSGASVARLWDVKTGRQQAELAGHLAAIDGANFIDRGDRNPRIVTWSADRLIRLWHSSLSSPAGELRGHRLDTPAIAPWARQAGSVAAAFSIDGTKLVTWVSNDRSLQLWDAATGGLEARLAGHSGSIQHAAFNPKRSNQLLTRAARDKSAFLWLLQDGGRPVGRALAHSDVVVNAAFNPNGRHVVTWSFSQNGVYLWDTEGGNRTELKGLRSSTANAKFSPDGRRLVYWGIGDNVVQLWNIEEQPTFVAACGGHELGITDVLFAPDNSLIATTALWAKPAAAPGLVETTQRERMIRLCHGKTGAPGPTFAWKEDWGSNNFSRSSRPHHISMMFSPDGRQLLAWGAEDRAARLWDVTAQSASLIGKPVRQGGPLWNATFSGNSEHLAIWSYGDRAVQLWSAKRGTQKTLLRDDWPIRGVVFRPDSAQLATISNAVRLWNADTGAMESNFERRLRGQVIGSATFSPNSAWLAVTAIGERAVSLWNPRTGSLVAEMRPRLLIAEGEGTPGDEVTFSSNSKTFVISGGDRPSLWQVLGEGQDLVAAAESRLACVRPSDLECEEFELELECKTWRLQPECLSK